MFMFKHAYHHYFHMGDVLCMEYIYAYFLYFSFLRLPLVCVCYAPCVTGVNSECHIYAIDRIWASNHKKLSFPKKNQKIEIIQYFNFLIFRCFNKKTRFFAKSKNRNIGLFWFFDFFWKTKFLWFEAHMRSIAYIWHSLKIGHFWP